MAGTLNLPMKYDELSALSPVVRKEVLTGELSRQIKGVNTVRPDELDHIVEAIVGLSLSDVVQAIQDPTKLAQQIQSAKKALDPSKSETPSKSPSPSVSQDSRLLDPNAPNATASAPDHPSTPLSMPATLSTPPRTDSPSGSVAPTSERDRIFAAVSKLEPSQAADITELMMSLPKRDRAMCLFNVEVLRAKIADAKLVLDAEGDEAATSTSAPIPQTPQARKISASFEQSPQTPELSSRGASANASPTPATPSVQTYTIASLARLPATEIIRLTKSSSATGLPLPKADELVVKATDEYMDGLVKETLQRQKQQVGDKLCVLRALVRMIHLIGLLAQIQIMQGVGHQGSCACSSLFLLCCRKYSPLYSPKLSFPWLIKRTCVPCRISSTATLLC